MSEFAFSQGLAGDLLLLETKINYFGNDDIIINEVNRKKHTLQTDDP